ncbi:MAG: IMP cyclohydrolase [Spirochaetes bacterium]|nr:IMP cyclohydrolase [Spirochaetota bacterium]
MSNLKESYKIILDDNFPADMEINLGGQILKYRKKTWKIEDNGELVEKGLRYGENPGQEAALYELINGNITFGECTYITEGNSLVSGLTEEMMLQFGKHPGKTNLTDIDNALNILKYLSDEPSVVIVKHNNPCGASQASTIEEAAVKAYYADRVAAFGGCIALNRSIDKKTAEFIAKEYFEVVVAPDFHDGAFEILKSRKNLRIVKIQNMQNLEKYKSQRFLDFKSLIDGGIIIQQSPLNVINKPEDFITAETEYKGQKYKIDRTPTMEEFKDLLFGWFIEQGVTSNSVIYVKDRTTVGIGTGEQDRVGVAEIAVSKAYIKYADRICFEKYGIPYKQLELSVEKGEDEFSKLKEINNLTVDAKAGLKGSAMVSDAFFPFRDGVDVGIKQGISSIVQPGGSMRDFESIIACNEADPKVAMVFTGQRAFKH